MPAQFLHTLQTREQVAIQWRTLQQSRDVRARPRPIFIGQHVQHFAMQRGLGLGLVRVSGDQREGLFIRICSGTACAQPSVRLRQLPPQLN